jgi:hypothetical protein
MILVFLKSILPLSLSFLSLAAVYKPYLEKKLLLHNHPKQAFGDQGIYYCTQADYSKSFWLQ